MRPHSRLGLVAALAVTLVDAPALGAQSGRYRITLNGFTVSRQTFDNPFQMDGKGDEVQLAAFVAFYDPSKAAPLDARPVKSRIFGDVNGHTGWIKAGTASAQGGLVSNNNVPAVADPWVRRAAPAVDNVPMQLWTGELVQGQNLVYIIPTVWEWDDKIDKYNEWVSNETIRAQARLDNGSLRQWLAYPSLAPIVSTFAWGDRPLLVRNDIPNVVDRPVGLVQRPELVQNVFFQQKTIVLTAGAIEAALQGTSTIGTRGPGIIEVTYADYEDWKGVYTLYLQVERVP